MKQLSLLTLALGVAATALGAQHIEKQSLRPGRMAPAKAKTVITSSHPKAERKAESQAMPTLNDILGEYDSEYTDQINGLYNSDIVTISAGSKEGEVIINFPIVATPTYDVFYDAQLPATYVDGVLTITAGTTGLFTTDDGTEYTTEIRTYHWRPTFDGLNSIPSMSATWDGTGFAFDPDDLFSFDEVYSDEGAWFCLDQIVLLKEGIDTGDPNEGWTSLGNATFQDGWVMPAFNIDQTDENNWYEVELQQNDADHNIYRLVDPYHGNFPGIQYNESTKPGYIQFNVSNPDYVIFETGIKSGFINYGLSLKKMYCYNLLGWAMAYTEMSADELIAEYGDSMPFLSVFKDNVVTVSSRKDENGQIENDACFGDQTDKLGAYYWVDSESKATDMSAKIIFPKSQGDGVDAIEAGCNEKPVYYNLQGVRIENPAKGEIVITRCGSKVTKTVK